MKFSADQHIKAFRILGQKVLRAKDPLQRAALVKTAQTFRRFAQAAAKANPTPRSLRPQVPNSESKLVALAKRTQRRAEA